MKITINLNGVSVQKIIPTSWKEVTFGQFIRLSQAKNDLSEILSVFTDIEPEIIRKAQIGNIMLIKETLAFIESEKMDGTIPDSLNGIKLPKNLELETIAQYEDLKMEALEIQSKGLEKYAIICAIYLTNPYSHEKAEELSKELFNAPCEEVVALGNFTLLKLTGLKNLGQSVTLNQNSRMRRLKLAMIGWLARLVFTARYYLWKRKLRSIVRSY